MERTIREGVKLHGYDADTAQYIKERLDERYGHEWHCVVEEQDICICRSSVLSYYYGCVEKYAFYVFRTLRSILDPCPVVEAVKLSTSDSRNEVNIIVSLCFVLWLKCLDHQSASQESFRGTWWIQESSRVYQETFWRWIWWKLERHRWEQFFFKCSWWFRRVLSS